MSGGLDRIFFTVPFIGSKKAKKLRLCSLKTNTLSFSAEILLILLYPAKWRPESTVNFHSDSTSLNPFSTAWNIQIHIIYTVEDPFRNLEESKRCKIFLRWPQWTFQRGFIAPRAINSLLPSRQLLHDSPAFFIIRPTESLLVTYLAAMRAIIISMYVFLGNLMHFCKSRCKKTINGHDCFFVDQKKIQCRHLPSSSLGRASKSRDL